MRHLTKFVTSLLATLLLASCAARAPERQAISALPNPESGWGRVYFSSGVIDIPYRPNIDARYNSQIGPVYIDEVNVGSPANGEYIAVDLKPGTYKMKWLPHESSEYSDPVVTSLQIDAGTSKYYACDIKVIKIQMVAPGLIPALISKGIQDQQPVEKTNQTVFSEKPNFGGSLRLVSYFKYDEAKPPKAKQGSAKQSGSTSEKLKELQNLRKDGVINERDYQQKKKLLLDQM